MDLEDIENEYRINSEKEDEAFFNKLNNAKSKEERKKVEDDYHKNLKIIFDEYHKKISKFLKRKDIDLFEKQEITEEEKKKETVKTSFKVEKFDFRRSYYERLRIWWKVFKFKSRINLRKFNYKITPSWLVIFFLEIKFSFISFYLDSRFFLNVAFMKVKKVIFKLARAIKGFLLKIYTFFKNIFSYILGKFPSSANKDEKKEKSTKDEPKSKSKT